MAHITYYVAMGFERDEEGELVAIDPMESQSSSAAIGRARSLAATKAGAVAFSRTGDPELGEFTDAVILFTAGDVPSELPVG
jgi:hypothetical protein